MRRIKFQHKLSLFRTKPHLLLHFAMNVHWLRGPVRNSAKSAPHVSELSALPYCELAEGFRAVLYDTGHVASILFCPLCDTELSVLQSSGSGRRRATDGDCRGSCMLQHSGMMEMSKQARN
jgi:hypothetical protein